MTVPRATKRRTSLERHKDEVIALLLGGYPDPQIIDKYKVARSSLSKFKQRHRDELTALQIEVARQVEDYAIAHRVNRIATLDHLKGETEAWIEENGLTERVQRFDEDGNLVGETLRYRADAVNALRAVLKDAAIEVDQLPRSGITFNDNRKVVFIREYGFSAE